MILSEGALLNDTYEAAFHTVGGMSLGYKGLKNGREFFVKEVEASESRLVLSLAQEKSMLERLSHPGIVKYIDFFEQDGFYYLITEFVRGQSLNHLISPISGVFLQEKIVTDWASQLYDIFEYLHRQSPPVIYRDLKPQNIMKDPDGRIHLIDFGIARLFKEDHLADTSPMGSAITASPEHYGGSQTDERSDIYTLGATLYFLLTNGAHNRSDPFEFASLRTINPKISEGLEKIVMKALAHEPKKRFQSIAEMRRAHLGIEKSTAAGPLAAGKGTGEALREDAWPDDEAKTVKLSRQEKAPPSPSMVLALVAITVILFGVGLINLVKLPGKGTAITTGAPPRTVTATVTTTSSLAVISPVPAMTPSSFPPPSTALSSLPAFHLPKKRSSPVAAKHTVTPQAPLLETNMPYETASPGFQRPFPPAPGALHPRPPTVFVTVTPAGMSATLENSSKTDDLYDFLDSVVPPGYERARSNSNNVHTYHRLIPGMSNELQRYVQVYLHPPDGPDQIDLYIERHGEKISRIGRIQDMRVEKISEHVAFMHYRWFPSSSRSLFPLSEYRVKDMVCLSLDRRSCYTLSGKTVPECFRAYEGEFDGFFKRFLEKAEIAH
jgi:serine/threonine protein kinase